MGGCSTRSYSSASRPVKLYPPTDVAAEKKRRAPVQFSGHNSLFSTEPIIDSYRAL